MTVDDPEQLDWRDADPPHQAAWRRQLDDLVRAQLQELARRTRHGLTDSSDGRNRRWEFEERETAVRRKLRERRLALGLSQEQLAERMTVLGFSMQQTSVTKIEAGSRPLRLAELYAFADALETPWIALISPARTGSRDDADVEALRKRVDQAHDRQEKLRARFLDALLVYSRAHASAEVDELYFSERLAAAEEGEGRLSAKVGPVDLVQQYRGLLRDLDLGVILPDEPAADADQ